MNYLTVPLLYIIYYKYRFVKYTTIPKYVEK